MKKLIVAAFAVVTAVALCVPALAFGESIEVKDVLDGETYTAYKILNYKDNGETGADRAVSYYLTSSEYESIGSVLEAAGFHFTQSADKTQWYVDNADQSKEDAVDVAEAAAYLHDHLTDLGSALGTATATGSGGSATFTDLPVGYYFVTTTAGSLCALHEDGEIATLVEKNTVPTVDKKEKTSGDEYVDGPVDANIGDTVHYQIVVTDGKGTDKDITLIDTMSDGLDYTAGTIEINGTSVDDDADTDNYSITVSGRTITIVLKADYVATFDEGDTITITFDATLNEDAVVDDDDANSNKVVMTYSEQESDDTVYVETYDFQLYKTDGTAFLDGAGFRLYDAATGGNEIKVGKDDTGYFVDDGADEEILVDSANGVNVRGLAPGTYFLEETTVPGGYNKLSQRESVTITTGATAAVEVTVINEAGAVLPSTGGMGTTILYIVGGIMIALAAAFLIHRHFFSKKDDSEDLM